MDPLVDGSGGSSIVPIILLGGIGLIALIIIVVGAINIIRYRGKKRSMQPAEPVPYNEHAARELRNAQANNALGRGIGRSL